MLKMSKKEFVNKIVGVPWVNRGFSFEGCDCFGLVYLYLLHVAGKVTPLTDEYRNHVDFTACFTAQLECGKWVKVDDPRAGGLFFMMYRGDIPMHCGVMLNKTDSLHAWGIDETGQAMVWKLAQIKRYLSRVYGLGTPPRVEFYEWVD